MLAGLLVVLAADVEGIVSLPSKRDSVLSFTLMAWRPAWLPFKACRSFPGGILRSSSVVTRSSCFSFRCAALHAVFGMRRAALLLTLPKRSRVVSSAKDRITTARYTIHVYRGKPGSSCPARTHAAAQRRLSNGAKPPAELVPTRGNWDASSAIEDALD